MAIRANPKLITELEIYGAQDVSKCYHCGNCSAICPFSKEPYIFPRRSMRSLQMGLEAKLESDLEPWLCYYCGECSAECPRDAEPGETMMSLRRWLTARYDFTGIARLFYLSAKAEILAVILVALITGAGFLLYGFSQGSITQYNGPDAFLPASSIHIFDWILAAVLLALLLTNCARMWWFTVGRDTKVHVPLSAYITKIYLLPMHFFTQMRYARCEQKRPWVIHLVLMLSYVTMLVLIMFFLAPMWSGPAIDWRVHVFGLAATAGLLVTTIVFLRKRLKKTEVQYQHSHETDWMFLVLLIVVAATGLMQFTLHRVGLETAANINYVIHMMAVVPMLLLEVPFSKWSHMAYRPLAMYFADLKTEAMVSKEREAVRAPQAA
ncbi:MAG: 4Fe-4S dicluster domain-containing protein [Actinomycetes bacterium]